MTVDELERACDNAEANGLERVQLLVPHQTRGRRVRLFGKDGPLSEEIALTDERGTLAWWKVSKIRPIIRRCRAALGGLCSVCFEPYEGGVCQACKKLLPKPS